MLLLLTLVRGGDCGCDVAVVIVPFVVAATATVDSDVVGDVCVVVVVDDVCGIAVDGVDDVVVMMLLEVGFVRNAFASSCVTSSEFVRRIFSTSVDRA
jgi:hypothetical protein